jgi:hypothetical protein
MQPNGFNFDLLIDAFADRVAAKVRAELSQDGAAPSIKPRLLSVEGAARYLSRTPSAVRNMIAVKKLKPVRLDGRVYLDVQELDRVIQAAKE